MTLPVSGPLSLTDIQTEFGGANPIGLTEYYAGGSYVPAGTTGTNGAVPSSGTISVNNFYGTSNAYDYSFQQTTYNSSVGTPIDLGGMTYIAISSDNIINAYGNYRSATGTTGTYLMRVSAANGAVLSKYYSTVVFPSFSNLALDTSNNLYAVARVVNTPTVTKYNSSGTYQWSVNVVGLNQSAIVHVSPAGTIYAGGVDTATGTKATLISMNSVGGAAPTSNNWAQTIVTGTSPFYNIVGIGTDSSNNVYAAGSGYNGTTTLVYQSFLVKYNSSGTLQWQRKLSLSSPSNVIIFQSATNSSGDTYMCGYSEVGGVLNPLVVKYNSSGTLQWQKTFAAVTITWRNVVIGASGNVYVIGTQANNTIYLVKYDSSGTVLWQRTIVRSGGTGSANVNEYSLSLDANETLYVAAQIGSNGTTVSTTGVIFKLPNDGSKTGTWTNVAASGTTFTYTYSATTYSAGSNSVVDAAGAFTFASVSLTPTSASVDWNTAIPIAAETFSATTTILP